MPPPPLFLVLPSPPYATQSASFFRLILDELIPSECDQSLQIGRGSWRGTLTGSFLHCIGYTQSGEEKQWRDDARRGSTSDARPGKFCDVCVVASFSISLFPSWQKSRETVTSAPLESVSSKQIWPLRKPSVRGIRTLQPWPPALSVLRRLRFCGMDFGWSVGRIGITLENSFS